MIIQIVNFTISSLVIVSLLSIPIGIIIISINKKSLAKKEKGKLILVWGTILFFVSLLVWGILHYVGY